MVEDDDAMVEHDDPTAQCPLALNGRGPFKGHCRACDNRLRPPRGYQVYDCWGRVIVSDRIDVPLWITSQPFTSRSVTVTFASALPRLR
jgi:hypothetical protein